MPALLLLVEDATPASRPVVVEVDDPDLVDDADVEGDAPACGGGVNKHFQSSHEMAAKPTMLQ